MSIARCVANDDKGFSPGGTATGCGGPGSAPSFPGPPLKLVPFAGYDPMEREIGIGTGNPMSETAKAMVRSRAAANRVERWRVAAAVNPPKAAKGGFPYNRRSVAQVKQAKTYGPKCEALVQPNRCRPARQCRNPATIGGLCTYHDNERGGWHE